MGDTTTLAKITPAIGKRIVGIQIVNEYALSIDLHNGAKVEICDDMHQCCERRWMHTDDNLNDYVGSVFMGASVREGGAWDETYDAETAFLIVSTSIGQFTVVNYNEHNGYYGGFDVRAVYTPGEGKDCLFM